MTAARRFKPWSGGAVAVVDLPWLLVESDRQPTHVAGVVIFQKPSDAPADFVNDLFGHMTSFSAPTAPFDRRLGRRSAGRFWPWWEPCPVVQLADHVNRSRLSHPGGERELEQAVAALHRTRLDRSRPLWEVHVIDGLANDRFAIYAKFHHSLVDGVGAMRILQAAFSTDPDVRDLPPVWAYSSGRLPRRPAPTRRHSLRALSSAAVAAGANLARRQAVKPYSAPRSVLNTAISSERTVAMVSLEAVRVRRLATAICGSTNDAFVLVCATALRRYLEDVDALPGRALTAAMPVSVRTAGTVDGNAITFAFVSLATDTEDHRSRAAQIVASTKSAKGRLAHLSKDAMDTYTIVTMAPLIMSQLVGLGAVLPPMFNVVISNIRGPAKQLFYNGATLVDLFPVSLLQSGQALNITALSYDGHLNVTFTACDASLPGVERLASYCSEALSQLEGALVAAHDESLLGS